MADYRLIHGDALDALRGMTDNSVDAIVCDPPAGINFMQKSFDSDRGGRTQWVAWLAAIMAEAKRVIKPGGHGLIWALPKTAHWTSCALEDAGWEIREKIYHIQGQGFPKSLNVSRELLALPWCACDVVTGTGTPSTGIVDEGFAASGTGLDFSHSVALAGGVLRSGAITGTGAERIVGVPEGLTAAGASLGVLSDSFGTRPGEVDVTTALPSENISASHGATNASMGFDGLAADSTGGLLSERDGSAGHRRSTVKRGVKERVGQFGPVMLRASDVAVVTGGDEVGVNVSGFQVQPEALRDEVMGDHAVSATTIATNLVPVDNGGADVLPFAPFVGPLSAAPSGVALTGGAGFVVNGHTSAGAVEGDGIASSDSPFELGATDDASEGLRATFELGASSPLERDGLVGSGTGPGTVLNFTATIGEDNATLWTGFGKHGSIIRQLVSECKVSVCPNCRQPQRPEWIVDGLGSALKPAVEEWILVRKPLSEPSIAANVLATGTGGINVDGCRVATGDSLRGGRYSDDALGNDGGTYGRGINKRSRNDYQQPTGRFPSHLLLSHHPSCIRRGEKRVKGTNPTGRPSVGSPANNSEGWNGFNRSGVSHADADGRELVADWECDAACPVFQLDAQAGVRKSGGRIRTKTNGSAIFGNGHSDDMVGREEGYYDAGNASRFFTVFEPDPDALFVYAPKASRRDREEGLDLLEARPGRPLGISQWEGQTNGSGKPMGPSSPAKNTHPTVKSTSLMRWLCRLITPPGGTVLDMFMGSGSTGCAALLENFSFIGVEAELEYFQIAEKRLAWAESQRPASTQISLFDTLGHSHE